MDMLQKTQGIILSAMVLLLGCQSQAFKITLGESFQLREGQSANYDDIVVTATDIIYSPCPEGAICVWSGLGVSVNATRGQETESLLLELGSSSKVFDYTLTLKELEPNMATFVME